MQNILSMNEFYALADLSHENSATALSQHKIIVNHPFK